MEDIASTTADRIREETERFESRDSTSNELAAAEVLSRCHRYRSSCDPAEAFGFVPKLLGYRHKRPGAPWVAGDLASGKTGSEFIYAYLPVRFVEELIERAQRTQVPSSIAETLTTGATVYFLNNLRPVLDEALVNLAFEASVVADVVGKAVMNVGAEKDNGLNQTREGFSKIIDEIISEGNTRRRERVRRAMWEIDPRLTLANLYHYYQRLYPIWKKAAQIYKKNAKLRTWKKIIQDEISQSDGVILPENLMSLLSPGAEPPNATGTIEFTPSGLALEHAARACGVDDFRYGTGHLRATITAQKTGAQKSAPKDSLA